MPRTRINLNEGCTLIHESKTDSGRAEPFLARLSTGSNSGGTQRRKQFHERYMKQDHHKESRTSPNSQELGEESWRNSEGERLADFGLDEETEFYDEGVDH